MPKFSKFIHGCATLLPNRVELVPFWLPQMETDIRKPATRKAAISRPPNSSSNTNSHTPSNTNSRSSATDLAKYTEPVSDDEDSEDNRQRGQAEDEAAWADLPPEAAAEAKAYRLQNAAAGASEGPAAASRPVKAQEIFPKLTPANLHKLLGAKYSRDQATNEAAAEGAADGGDPSGFQSVPGRMEYVSSFRAQPGKRVAIPVRVEPKVFYANERTTLSWIEFSVVVSAIGVGLLSFSDPHDDIALAAAGCFTAVALLSLVYTAGRYVWRVGKIRNREAVNYHDWLGPTVLCAVLFVAVIVNGSLRWKSGL